MNLSEFNPIPNGLENPTRTFFEVARYVTDQEFAENYDEAKEAEIVLAKIRVKYNKQIFTKGCVERIDTEVEG